MSLDPHILRRDYSLVMYKDDTPSVYKNGSNNKYNHADDFVGSAELPAATPRVKPTATPTNPYPPLPLPRIVIPRPLPAGPPMFSINELYHSPYLEAFDINICIPVNASDRIRSSLRQWISNKTFPPTVRWIESINFPDLRDVSVHIAYSLIRKHALDPALFAKTFDQVFSVPGFAAALASLDHRVGYPPAPDPICDRLPPMGCGLFDGFEVDCHRSLVRYLAGECQWTDLDFKITVEPFVARKNSGYFWNPLCRRHGLLPAPGENMNGRLYYDEPHRWVHHPPVPVLNQHSSFLFPYDIDQAYDRFEHGYVAKQSLRFKPTEFTLKQRLCLSAVDNTSSS